jgi:rsbT antagonist protein RsbS
VPKGSIPILRVGPNLLATVHVELRDAVAEAFQEDILTELERRAARGLVIDVSGLDVVDTYVARVLSETGRMAKLMGTETVLVGIRPDVAATLIRMGYNMDGVLTALNVDDGIETLAQRAAEVARERGLPGALGPVEPAPGGGKKA